MPLTSYEVPELSISLDLTIVEFEAKYNWIQKICVLELVLQDECIVL